MSDSQREQYNQALLDLEKSLEPVITEPLAILRRNCRTYADADEMLHSVVCSIGFQHGDDFRIKAIDAIRVFLEQEKNSQTMAGGFFAPTERGNKS